MCMYIYIYLYIYCACVCVGIYIYIYIYIVRVYGHGYMWVYVYACVCVYICLYSFFDFSTLLPVTSILTSLSQYTGSNTLKLHKITDFYANFQGQIKNYEVEIYMFDLISI